jgi:hypothetical protein
MMTIAIAATAACAAVLATRSRHGSDQVLAGIFGAGTGTTVPATVVVRMDDDQFATRTDRYVAPTTGVVSPHLMAPPG